jgi:hypothetical protein
MNTTPVVPTPEAHQKLSVEAARQLLEQALRAEAEDEAPEVSQDRAINAYTGASILVPPVVAAREVPAFAEPASGT